MALSVVSTQEGRRLYFERMSELYTNVWHVQAILRRVDQLAAVIRPVIAESGSSLARYHDGEVENLKERISLRDASLRRQLASLSSQPRVLPRHLTGWTRETELGAPDFKQSRDENGNEVLYLGAKGNAICSWRAKLSLEEGIYRFEGRVRTHNVRPSSGEPNGGAGLRIHGGRVGPELKGDQDWQKFSYPFRVPEGGGEVQAVCELRAAAGEAWFDSSSLRVVRVR